MKDTANLATSRSRGMHICHFDGFFQKSGLTVVKARGAGSGWGGGSNTTGVSKPISERLPMVNRRVMAQHRAGLRIGENEW